MQIRDLLHADRVLRLLSAMDITFAEAAALDDESAGYLLEAIDIDQECTCQGCIALAREAE